MALKFEADLALSLSKRAVEEPDINQRWYWNGWKTRQWPAGFIRPGIRVYGFDKRPDHRRLRYLLEITRGGEFRYTSKADFVRQVKSMTDWTPSEEDGQWARLPIGTRLRPAIGVVCRWKLVKLVDIPYSGRFSRIGWKYLREGKPPEGSQLDAADLYEENRRILRTHLARERKAKLRADSKAYWRNMLGGRLFCIICGCDFGKTYGSHGKDFIEMHHEVPLASRQGVVQQTMTALVPLCSNCHRMVHRNVQHPLSLEELKKIYIRNRRH